MSDQGNCQGIYVDLDCLLDTRLAILERELGVEQIDYEAYRLRQIDEWDQLDKETFRSLYAKRDKALLKSAVLTNMSKLISRVCQDCVAMLEASPIFSSVKLYVNVYPYQLDDDEREEILYCVSHLVNGLVPIELIDFSLTDLNVDWVGAHLDVMFMYDPHAWLNSQIMNFQRHPLTEVKLIAPALFQEKLPQAEDYDALDREKGLGLVFFDAVSHTARGWINLNFIDVAHYCILDPKTYAETYLGSDRVDTETS